MRATSRPKCRLGNDGAALTAAPKSNPKAWLGKKKGVRGIPQTPGTKKLANDVAAAKVAGVLGFESNSRVAQPRLGHIAMAMQAIDIIVFLVISRLNSIILTCA
jgi:hypothetical protein